MSNRQNFREYVKDYQRFSKSEASNLSETKRQKVESSNGESLIPSTISELMIEIGLDGKKYLINSNKQKAIVLPKFNKFFLQYSEQQKPPNPVEEHNLQLKYESLKELYKEYFKVSTSSIIYNYHFLQIQLFSQMYADKVNPQEKRVIEGEFYQLKRDAFISKLTMLGYVSLFVGTRRASWMKLTRNNYLWGIGLAFFSLGFMQSKSSYQNFIFTSVLKYNKVYQRVINQYENDYKIHQL